MEMDMADENQAHETEEQLLAYMKRDVRRMMNSSKESLVRAFVRYVATVYAEGDDITAQGESEVYRKCAGLVEAEEHLRAIGEPRYTEDAKAAMAGVNDLGQLIEDLGNDPGMCQPIREKLLAHSQITIPQAAAALTVAECAHVEAIRNSAAGVAQADMQADSCWLDVEDELDDLTACSAAIIEVLESVLEPSGGFRIVNNNVLLNLATQLRRNNDQIHACTKALHEHLVRMSEGAATEQLLCSEPA